MALNGAAVATVLAYSSPAFTAIASWKLFGERMGWIEIVAVVLSIIGCRLSPALRPGGAAGQSARHRHRLAGRRGFCRLQPDGQVGFAARLEFVDDAALHFCDVRPRSADV